MAVRNQLKASAGKGNYPRRHVFRGDVASLVKPEHNPSPTTKRGQRRLLSGGANPKVPGELLVGLAHRTHVEGGKGVPGGKIKGYHGSAESHTRFIPLTKAYKSK